jgi:hypothetical protein
MIMLFIVLFHTETNFVYLWEGYEATTIKALKTERDQLRSEAPPVVPSFAQASKRGVAKNRTMEKRAVQASDFVRSFMFFFCSRLNLFIFPIGTVKPQTRFS